MTALLAVIAVEYTALAVLTVATIVRDLRERAHCRREAIRAFTTAPMSTRLPTTLRQPTWTEEQP